MNKLLSSPKKRFFKSFSGFKQAFLEKMAHLIIKVNPGVATINAMITVGINHQVKWFIGFDKGVDHLHRILIMDIVIAATVD